VRGEGREEEGCGESERTTVQVTFLLGIRMRIFALRQCTDYARASYVGAGTGEVRVAHITFAVGLGEAWC